MGKDVWTWGLEQLLLSDGRHPLRQARATPLDGTDGRRGAWRPGKGLSASVRLLLGDALESGLLSRVGFLSVPECGPSCWPDDECRSVASLDLGHALIRLPDHGCHRRRARPRILHVGYLLFIALIRLIGTSTGNGAPFVFWPSTSYRSDASNRSSTPSLFIMQSTM
ncbi:hypothetical protein B0T24DRAFT_590833 [Lasiosphaeria ovina]|uniref:Uncharacterized protein n=1 Tax=Lasiosphaeria ovina TaxID=92902 RepID=A0AAE0NF32_9PEZI|nr:hypothetical protein B0T24DRAFT_590833 [Lasiosphaeria ovina]